MHKSWYQSQVLILPEYSPPHASNSLHQNPQKQISLPVFKLSETKYEF